MDARNDEFPPLHQGGLLGQSRKDGFFEWALKYALPKDRKGADGMKGN
jgi:hypothetical protein